MHVVLKIYKAQAKKHIDMCHTHNSIDKMMNGYLIEKTKRKNHGKQFKKFVNKKTINDIIYKAVIS